MAHDALERVRQIALALPEVTERVSAGAPCFFVRDRKPICRFHDSGFAGDGRISLWCPAPPGVRDELVTSEPDRFFAPTPSASGVFGDWIGVYLDTKGELAVDWQEIAAIIEEAYRLRGTHWCAGTPAVRSHLVSRVVSPRGISASDSVPRKDAGGSPTREREATTRTPRGAE